MVRGILTSKSPGLSLLWALSAYVQVVRIPGGRDNTVNLHPEPAGLAYFFLFYLLFPFYPSCRVLLTKGLFQSRHGSRYSLKKAMFCGEL